MTTTRGRHATHGRRVLSARTKVLRAVAALVALPMVVTGLVTIAGPAGAAGTVAPTLMAGSSFPLWYADTKGDRVEPCLDAADTTCILPAVGDEPGYDPRLPLSFPKNFPTEFFYAYAASNTVTTPGCGTSPAGKASVVLALEGAFINGDPAPGDQMVFGRIRVRVSSGLCPNTDYLFRHPFGEEAIRTNDAGAVTATLGTEDIGCVPTATVPCDFHDALSSRVFGAGDGFLRWTADPALAPGYLGDGVTPHAITGGTGVNEFAILDGAGTALDDGAGNPLSTSLFTVSGKLAGPLVSDGVDFGGVAVGTSQTRPVTVTNIGTTPVTVAPGAATVLGDPGSRFAVAPSADGSCVSPDGDVTVPVDGTCTLDVTFSPDDYPAVSDIVDLASTGGLRSPLSIHVSGTGINAGDAPAIAPVDPLAFGDVRIREEKSLTATLTNNGLAPLRVADVALTGDGASQYRLAAQTCTTGGRTIPVGGTCDVTVTMRPFSRGAHAAVVEVTSNVDGGLTTIDVTGTATGGTAAVSATEDPYDGFPYWYRDENAVKVSQCIDPQDPYCVVLPDGGYDPSAPQAFPTNFPGEFFYTVADSEPVTTPGCDGGPEGTAFIRSAVEGTFVNGSAAFDEQMVFGRVRIVVRGGLCPDTDYTFVHPYGTSTIRTNEDGSIKPIQGTVDIGCAPLPPATCDFSEALSSPVFGGFLRWDPAVSPAAPPGYLGDAVTFHPVVGAPYLDETGNPANYFRILDPADGSTLAQSDTFTVMGKLRGPLEVTDGVDAAGHVNLGAVAMASTSGTAHVVYTNTGLEPIEIGPDAVTISGTDAGDFTVAGDSCSSATLAVDDTCTVDVSFSPTATGNRTADLRVVHSGMNSPVVTVLDGIGGAEGDTAAISFQPRSLTFAQLAVNSASAAARVTISNVGGSLPLSVSNLAVGGAPDDFAIVDDSCRDGEVAPGGTCWVDVVFTPTRAGAIGGSLVVTDNAPGTTHSVALTGTASAAGKGVSAAVDPNGFPRFYTDENGVRIEPCLDTNGKCVVLPDATYKANQPLVFPTNFPGEFFYAVADSDVVALDGCGGATEPGTALLRVALEGTFADGSPSFNDQMTFTRIRFTANSGLCPNVPYQWVSPYGVFSFTTNAVGGLPRNEGTIDIGCPAVVGTPCVFADALDSPVPAGSPGVAADRVAPNLPRTPIDGFLRWDPNQGAAAPAGYLGDATTLHKVVGGTYQEAGATGPTNRFEIRDLADNTIAGTDLFAVSGKIAGPLYASTAAVAFGHQPSGTQSGLRTVTVTNVGPDTTVHVAKTGLNADQFLLDGSGTCDTEVTATDGTCTIKVRFAPTGDSGARGPARLVITADGDPAARTVVVDLTGLADPPLAPAISVSPGILSFTTVTAPGTADRTTTITNTGTAPLNVGSVTVTGPAASDYSIFENTCAADLAAAVLDDAGAVVTPAGTCTVTVRFKPSAQGPRVATLTINHNAQGNSTLVSLTGTGLGSQFSLSPNPIGFSKVSRNTTKSSSVSIKNTGTIPVRLTAAVVNSATPGIFGTTNGTCIGQVVQAGRSCTMNVTFRPTALVNYSGTLVVTGDNTSLPASVSVSVTGSGK
ncbi:choice-of-anchor D domain-containing protein [Kineosporia sp. R_H_3]|uniref:choice-of-anchor D domain-containing protein n=1 Tax=Kineosporia sp. R_H_3 TaxID=1961848 RepID=UPI000B4BEA99|nr:choice-of-anchor D domain-containing protein [Kineosporia sp. R_H_3]